MALRFSGERGRSGGEHCKRREEGESYAGWEAYEESKEDLEEVA